MDSSLKRAVPTDDEPQQEPQAKRQRTTEPDSRSVTPADVDTLEKPAYNVVRRPNAEDFGRDGLRRSIGVALKHVGFDAATPDALESFTETVDTYITGFIKHLRRTANAARRNDPIPEDFELILRRHDVDLSSLKLHLKNPVREEYLTPSFFDPVTEDVQYLQKPRPFLGEELSGEKEKEARPWIPKNFPAFPSAHTYKFTPAKLEPDIEKEQLQAEADAKKGEAALRRINRAARISRQKELRAVAQREPLSRKRHQNWETIMSELLPKAGPPASGAPDIADHSTIVNFGTKYGRKGMPKTSRRPQTDPFNGLI
ncbi:uncharacterized protein F4812DRAFT_459070 [Daldinia caldariorum]|uniref:uncharacterized protein n=1 Tax=Daldinia caldariorum TaxID=326644 RepID=UPI0020089853|nr:uncharacterized protein F4812DRAFT_459070 [Daldinia caldariorum]KAI1467781.1 hypothetical protein F4812DRAFT_459070 [Daldinia caldariorum]